jgi:hypothetical protein
VSDAGRAGRLGWFASGAQALILRTSTANCPHLVVGANSGRCVGVDKMLLFLVRSGRRKCWKENAP